jgi:hypothetical protein
VDELLNKKFLKKISEKYIDMPTAIIGFKNHCPSNNVLSKYKYLLFCNITSNCLNSYEGLGRRLVPQKVRCGKKTCHCAKPDGELHG